MTKSLSWTLVDKIRLEKKFVVFADVLLSCIMLVSASLVAHIMPYFKCGVSDRVALAPLTHVVLLWSWLLWVPFWLSLILTIINVCGGFVKQRVWQSLILVIIFVYATTMTGWIWGVSWPCWNRQGVAHLEDGVGG